MLQVDVEPCADGACRTQCSVYGERASGVFRNLEIRFAIDQPDVPMLPREAHLDVRAGIEHDARAILQNQGALLSHRRAPVLPGRRPVPEAGTGRDQGDCRGGREGQPPVERACIHPLRRLRLARGIAGNRPGDFTQCIRFRVGGISPQPLLKRLFPARVSRTAPRGEPLRGTRRPMLAQRPEAHRAPRSWLTRNAIASAMRRSTLRRLIPSCSAMSS